MSSTLVAREPVAGLMNRLASSRSNDETHTLSCWQGGWHASYTLADLDRMALRLARHLRHMGLRRGDRMGICAKNRLEWVLLDLAAIKAGVQTACFEPGHYTKNLDLMQRYGLSLLYTDEPLHGAGVVDIRTVMQSIDAVAEGEPFATHYGGQDCTTVKFTSGSTGTPKGLEASVASIERSLLGVQQIFEHGEGDTLLIFLPLSLLQQRYWVYSALLFGHDVVLTTFEHVFAVLPQARPTVVMGVPGFYDALKRRIEMADDGHGLAVAARVAMGDRVRYLWSGSAPAAHQTLDFFDRVGIPLFEGYGMNETCIVSKNYPGAHRRGSAGRVLPHKRVRIDERGVLYVGADDPVNTRYLFGALGDSERVFMPDGEVRTGDLARIDDDGYLYILGRSDDMIVLANGKNVVAPCIESRITEHPGVTQCVAIGAGRPFLIAVVALRNPSSDREAVQRHVHLLNESIRSEERVGRVIFAHEPFSAANGLLSAQFKPRRRQIEAAYAAQIDHVYGAFA
jgi:long-chain acyl-CoA synthetase